MNIPVSVAALVVITVSAIAYTVMQVTSAEGSELFEYAFLLGVGAALGVATPTSITTRRAKR